jgi:hypothetical protein
LPDRFSIACSTASDAMSVTDNNALVMCEY